MRIFFLRYRSKADRLIEVLYNITGRLTVRKKLREETFSLHNNSKQQHRIELCYCNNLISCAHLHIGSIYIVYEKIIKYKNHNIYIIYYNTVAVCREGVMCGNNHNIKNKKTNNNDKNVLDLIYTIADVYHFML